MENNRSLYHGWPEGPGNGWENTISVIGPCYNERDNLLRFIESAEDVLNKEKY